MPREELINFRKKEKLTQNEMSQILEISHAMYQALEYGLRNPSLTTLNKFKQKFPKANIDKIFLSFEYTKSKNKVY